MSRFTSLGCLLLGLLALDGGTAEPVGRSMLLSLRRAVPAGRGIRVDPPVVQCTVLAPQWVTEYCPQTIAHYRRETRERSIVVYRDVPFIKTIEEAYTVMVPETRTARWSRRSTIRSIGISSCGRQP